MAIAFARLQYVKRSEGRNACQKAAYNGRLALTNDRTGERYSYGYKGDSAYHEILCPVGAHERFQSAESLWSAVEHREQRCNSQVAKEMVFALPDDGCVAFGHKVALARQFVEQYFVNEGLIVQLDLHEPHGQEDHNWHAHVLMTTRRLTPCGTQLGEKARDLDGEVRGGQVVEAQRWGELWRDFQNAYFKEHGIDLRVDETGIIPQAHLGPVRLRARAWEMMQSHLDRMAANEQASQDPAKILEHLTERSSVFWKKDVDDYLNKHVPSELVNDVREAFWKQKEILELYTPEEADSLGLGHGLGRYTTTVVKAEEDRVLRMCDRLSRMRWRNSEVGSQERDIASTYGLSDEQRKAFEGVFTGANLVCVQGRAGTGKSHMMGALREAFEGKGYRVRGLAPTSMVAKHLGEKGFEGAQNIHRFLFQQHHNVEPLTRKEVLMVDEGGMISTPVMQELIKLAWDHGAKVVLVGDDRQLPSVSRGGLFKVMCERYGAYELKEVRRQHHAWQKQMSETLSQGPSRERIKAVVETLEDHDRLHWVTTKDMALTQLVDLWTQDRLTAKGDPEGDSVDSFFIMEHRNKYVLVINEQVRNVRKTWGEVSPQEYRCETFLGTCYISEGDRLQFRANDRDLGVQNGTLGTVMEAKETCFVVKTDDGREVAFNPQRFNRYHLGYAGTYHQSQGKTVTYAYGLHSPRMNHNLFYVGMTRQTESVHYIVSEDEAKDKAMLIRQLSWDGSHDTTVRYVTPKEMRGARRYGSKVHQAMTYIKDKLYRNHDFYRVDETLKEKEDLFRGYEVKALSPLEALRAAKALDPVRVFKKVVRRRRPVETGSSSDTPEVLAEDKLAINPQVSDRLSAHGRQTDKVDPRKGQTSVPGQTVHSLKERVQGDSTSFHRASLRDRREELDGIVNDLKGKMTDVCRALFPEPPSQMRGHEWRYGAKGSLKVTVSGPKHGGYANFESGERGGPLHLICEARGCTMKEAIGWAKDFLGRRESRDQGRPGTPGTIASPRPAVDIVPDWISHRPESAYPAPKLGQGCLEKMAYYHRETARYAYEDHEGNLLFYVVRLETKDPRKPGKMTLPLSYGVLPHSGEATPRWALKKYQMPEGEPYPLYNLKTLMSNLAKPVLIVEGEKTAEAAQRLLPEVVVVTWHGGAGALDRCDVHPLKGRQVLLWPDNDVVGHKAMELMSERCKSAGAQSVHRVTLSFGEGLPKLPAKWDLGDPLPKGLTLQHVRDQLAQGLEAATQRVFTSAPATLGDDQVTPVLHLPDRGRER